jgi:RNA-directed DNA polymerase
MGLFSWIRRMFGLGTSEPSRSGGPITLGPDPRPTAPSQPPGRREGKRQSLNLDLAQFAPLSDADARKQARGLGSLWGNPWFGRRDLIPPASDERTLIIDRAMVGHGMLTPEELADIHAIGEQMDKIRPDLTLAKQAADQAVARERADRQAAKLKKKAEAAERRRVRAEAVAQRRATDITYLGPGVSSGLFDRRANVEKLDAAGLPLLASPVDVADALGVSVSKLRWLTFHSEASPLVHYVRFSVPKKSGGTRDLAAPHCDLAACQSWILKNILEKVTPHAAAHGFVTGRNTLSNATPHTGRAVVVNCDLRDFFPTVTFVRIRGVFRELGYSPAAATILSLLTTESPRRVVKYAGRTLHVAAGPRALPQGACTSPALSNLVARRLDSRLAGIAATLGWVYTRYADDLTFSSETEGGKLTGYLLARVRHIVADEGFRVNEDKTRVLRRNTAQMVTGIVVNTRPGVRRRLARRIRAILHRAKTTGLMAQNRENMPHFEAWLSGMIAYVSMVNPDQGRALRTAFERLRR